MLLLTNDDVRQVLTMPVVMDALRESYLQLIRGEAVCRPNISTNIPVGQSDAFFKWSTMEGGSAVTGYFAMRLKCDLWYRHEYASEQHEIVTNEWYSTQPGKFCGLVFLVRTANAEPLAIIHDSHLQRMRVGADGAIGTDYMARPDASVMGVLGSGGIARMQVAATMRVRPIKRVQVYSPTKEHREAFAREIAGQYGIEAVAVEQGRDAFKGADIVAGCTDGGFKGEEDNAAIIGRWLGSGVHFTDVGGGMDSEARSRIDVALRLGTAPGPVGIPGFHVPDETVSYAVPVDNPAYADQPYYIALNSRRARGEPAPEKTVYLADLLAGKAAGRVSAEQITFSERGNLQGAQFHAVAAKAYELARARGIGREVPTEWFLQDERN
jgi:ornithine cyclodeaminase/alanine dehydrogenase-like protein (mu-crystallin family)